MTDSEYALLANAVTSLDAAILAQMKRRAEVKDKLRSQVAAATKSVNRLIASSSGLPSQDILVVLLSLGEISQIINDTLASTLLAAAWNSTHGRHFKTKE